MPKFKPTYSLMFINRKSIIHLDQINIHVFFSSFPKEVECQLITRYMFFFVSGASRSFFARKQLMTALGFPIFFASLLIKRKSITESMVWLDLIIITQTQ